MIREMRSEDCPVVAKLWREEPDVPAASDESVRSTFEKMSTDGRYSSFVAVEDGIVAGFITMVEVLSFDDPHGYIKMNGIAILPEYLHRGIGSRQAGSSRLDRRAAPGFRISSALPERTHSCVPGAIGFRAAGRRAEDICLHAAVRDVCADGAPRGNAVFLWPVQSLNA